MGNEVPQPGYAANAKPDVEAKGDATNIRTVLERDGATAAADRLRQEVDAVPAAQRDAYNAALLKELQGDGRTQANVLPELAIAFGLQNKDNVTDKQFRAYGDPEGRVVSQDKLNKAIAGEANPVYRELYRQFGDQYKAIKQENAEAWTGPYGQKVSPLETLVPARQLQERLDAANTKKVQQTENRNNFGELVTNPKLFDGIAGADGNITKDKVNAFQEKWNAAGPAGAEFRKQFATTPEAEQRVAKTLETLKNAYDDPKHKGNVPGSVIKDNRMTTLGIEAGSSYGNLTRDSLLKGLGYKDMAEAKARLPLDAPAANAAIKPIAEVNSVTNYSSTAQGYREGPAQVANRMLRGDTTQDQTKFFTKPDEAQRMLTDVLKQPDIWKFDQQGKPHVTAENRDQVLAAIKAAEVKKATDSRQPENNELSKWFESRYPKLPTEAAPTPTRGEPTATTDWNHLKLKDKNDGPRAIAGRMLQGQEAFFDDPARAARDLATALGVKAGIHNNRQGAEQVTKDNYDKVIDSIKATNNPQLLAWFQKRYLKPS